MKSYYAHMNLPEPVIPAVQTLKLLKGQTALVTGANSGIGRAIAISLGRAAANVVVNYVAKPEDAEAVAEEIRSGGQRAMTALADVGLARPPRSARTATVLPSPPSWKRYARPRYRQHPFQRLPARG